MPSSGLSALTPTTVILSHTPPAMYSSERIPTGNEGLSLVASQYARDQRGILLLHGVRKEFRKMIYDLASGVIHIKFATRRAVYKWLTQAGMMTDSCTVSLESPCFCEHP